jgi:hypothetical protein
VLLKLRGACRTCGSSVRVTLKNGIEVPPDPPNQPIRVVVWGVFVWMLIVGDNKTLYSRGGWCATGDG